MVEVVDEAPDDDEEVDERDDEVPEEEPDDVPDEEPDDDAPDEDLVDDAPDEDLGEVVGRELGVGVEVRAGVGALRGAVSDGVARLGEAAVAGGVEIAVAVVDPGAACAWAMAPPMTTAPTTPAIAVVAVSLSTRRAWVSRWAGVQRCTSSSRSVPSRWDPGVDGTVPDEVGSGP